MAAQGQPVPLTPPSNQCLAQWQQMVSCLSDGKGLCLNGKIWSAFSAVTRIAMEENWILKRFYVMGHFYSSRQNKDVEPGRFIIYRIHRIIQAA